MIKFNYKKNLSLNFVEFIFQSFAIFFIYKFSILKLGLDNFGLYIVILTYSSLIKLFDLGIASSALKFLSSKNITKKNQSDIIFVSFTFYIIYFFILSIISYFLISFFYEYLISDKIANFTQIEYLNLLKYSVVFTYLSIMTSILENIVRGLHCYYLFSFFKIIGNIIQTIFLFIMLENNNITLLFQAQIINHIFLFICGIFIIFYLNGFLSKITFKFYFKVFSELFKYGIKFYFGSSINYLFLVSQKIFVNHFGSFELVGIYEIAHRLVTFLKQILTLPLTNYFPILNYGLKKNQLSKNTFYNNLINVFVNKISLFIFILFIFCSYPISFLFFKTIDYFFIITIILLSFGFYINLKSSVIYLEYLSKEIFIKIIIHNLIGLISFLFLSIILNILFPLYAIVLGVTISMIISSCYLFITYEK